MREVNLAVRRLDDLAVAGALQRRAASASFEVIRWMSGCSSYGPVR